MVPIPNLCRSPGKTKRWTHLTDILGGHLRDQGGCWGPTHFGRRPCESQQGLVPVFDPVGRWMFSTNKEFNDGKRCLTKVNNPYQLVVDQPLWKIWLRQLGWWLFPIYGKIIQSCSKPPTSIYFPWISWIHICFNQQKVHGFLHFNETFRLSRWGWFCGWLLEIRSITVTLYGWCFFIMDLGKL